MFWGIIILFSIAVAWFCISISSIWNNSESVCLSVVSSSLQIHGLQPTRLLCPWDSPGKNTGVGSHALPQASTAYEGLNFSTTSWFWTSFHIPVGHLYVLFGEITCAVEVNPFFKTQRKTTQRKNDRKYSPTGYR